MKTFFLSCFLCLSITCLGQNSIMGPTSVQPGEQATYFVSFNNWDWNWSTTNWNVLGGVVLWSDDYSCTVQWNTGGGGLGVISAEETWYYQSADLLVQIGVPEPYINYTLQHVLYGASPDPLEILFDVSPPSNTTYQWQVWDETSQFWSNLTGETTSIYYPSTAVGNEKYRCEVDVNGTFYTNLECTIDIPPLSPGTISFNGPTNFNSVPVLNASDASGGYCLASAYAYSWEISVENGPWQQVGTGSNPPSISALIGNTKIRRKITCNLEQTYSNTIEIDPLYTAVDFENKNYVREISVIKKGIRSWQEADQLPVGDKFQSTNYMDGSGKTIQTVSKQVSETISGWQDIVQHFDYGSLTERKDFISYSSSQSIGKFKENALSHQENFIRTFFNEPNAPTYHTTKTDDSPLSLITKELAPGLSWGGDDKGVINSYELNSVNENVHIWNVAHIWNVNTAPTFTIFTNSNDVYGTGMLKKVRTEDPDNNEVISYFDFSGNIILKKVRNNNGPSAYLEHEGWICTYYVYDDFNQLRSIITPKAVEYLDNNSWVMTDAIFNALCYKYYYDEKGRVVVQKQPEIEESYMIYDKKDRLVLSQTANQRKLNNITLANNQWTFFIYDELDREVATGLLENNYNRQTLQKAVNKLNNFDQSIVATLGNSGSETLNNIDHPVIGGNTGQTGIDQSVNIVFNSVTHYDDYNYTGLIAFNNTYDLAFTVSGNVEQSVQSNRIRNFITGQKIRIIDNDNNSSNDKFLFSTAYYDQYGRTFQTIGANHKDGIDYSVNQYDFSGNILSSYSSHSISGGSTYTTISKTEYDIIGRPKKYSKKFNNSFYKALAEYTYDELGQIKEKNIAPGYNGTQLEKQIYSYNIQGQLTGLNKNFALSSNNYSQWDYYYSYYLGYDNRDNLFADKRLNGSITGIIWRTQGDNTPRKYDIDYDEVGRFKSAVFTQRDKPSETAWANNKMNFSVEIEYEDDNGNIKSLMQMGVVPGANGVRIVDDLRYTYKDITGASGLQGNQLKQVEDLGNLGSFNGNLGDFKDGNAVEDYSYDVSGNLVKDLNKNIQINGASGVEYNYLNLPIKYTIHNKSVVEYSYDASGTKLTKKITNSITNQSRTTYYLGDFVYEQINQDAILLRYILHEEGRIKIIEDVNTDDRILNAGTSGLSFPNNKQGVFEYFLRDHLGSTRMVLTEEYQKEMYKASMELSNAALEEPLFGKVESNGTIAQDNELKVNRIENDLATTPWPNNGSDIIKLTAAKPIGPNMMLKVMAGDIITTSAKYYYLQNNASGGNPDPVSEVVNSLVNALLSPSKGSLQGKTFSTSVNSDLYANMGSFINNQPSTGDPNAPKAFLNIVFLDEQFKFVEQDLSNPGVGTTADRVSDDNNPNASFNLLQQKAPKNGWVFVYLSNESNESVYFDDLYVNLEHGRIAEEMHYYPNGLKIAALSSRAFNKLETTYGFQGDFSEEESETGYSEFLLRQYDPQIGRWTGADPYGQYSSPYIGMGNDPVNRIDPDGGWDWLLNKETGQWQWFDEISSYSEYLNSDLTESFDYIFTHAKGGFISDFAGKEHLFLAGGVIDDMLSLPGVVVGNYVPQKSFDLMGKIGAEKFKYYSNQSWFYKAQIFTANVVKSVYNGAVGLVDMAINKDYYTHQFGNFADKSIDYLKRTDFITMSVDLGQYAYEKVQDPHFWEDAVAGAAPGMKFKMPKGGTQVTKVSGSYLLEFESGNFYAGKGLESRMKKSIKRIETNYDDKLVKSTFYPAPSTRAAFINEHVLMMQSGGPKSFNPLSPTYNKIFSPGKKLGGF